MQRRSVGSASRAAASPAASDPAEQASTAGGGWRLPSCCRRRSAQGLLNVGLGVFGSSAAAAFRVVGAAGGGWALLAAVRAVAGGGEGKASSRLSETAASADADDNAPPPRHIAVIMDGNRRFGRRVYGSSLAGHKAGGEKLREFLAWSVEEGVQYLTVFAFSTENWKREPAEVEGMMQLFLTEVPRLGAQTTKLNVRVRFLISDGALLPDNVRRSLEQLEADTSACTGLQLNVCLSYGGRGDVVHACQMLARQVAAGELKAEDIDEQAVTKCLLTGDIPDPDVLIRTSGERRLSNFLMYQLAYAEMFFLDKHWPEVTHDDFNAVVSSFKHRQRRFGK